MRRLPGKLTAFALLAWAGACDSTAPIEPETLVIEAGNNQNGSTGRALPEVLSVRVTGSDGQAFAGASVNWEVESGDAAVAPATSTTDQAGIASTTVTLGATPGAVVVSATVDGLAAVSFNASASSDCDAEEPYTIGTTVEGTLDTDDCQLSDETRVDRFSFSVTQVESIRFTLSSTVMNPFLGLEDAAGNNVAFHDDVSATDRTANMRVFLAPGSYVVTPSGFAPTDLGAYTFSSALDTSPVSGCGFFENWVTRGVQLTQDLAETDCPLEDQSGNRYFVHLYFMYLRQGETVSISQASAALDSYVELYRVTQSGLDFIAFNDDADSTSNDALLAHEVTVNGVYLILPSSAGPEEVGAYTMSVN